MAFRCCLFAVFLVLCGVGAAIDIQGEVRKDLPGQGIFAGPVPSGVILIEWEAGVAIKQEFLNRGLQLPDAVLHKSVVFIDAMPDSSRPSPCYVITYRDRIDWHHEERNERDPRVFDIAYPGVCWFDNLGRVHVDSRDIAEEYVVGPVGGFSLFQQNNKWYPDSFLIGANNKVRIKDTTVLHQPTTGFFRFYASPESDIYRELRMVGRGMLAHTW